MITGIGVVVLLLLGGCGQASPNQPGDQEPTQSTSTGSGTPLDAPSSPPLPVGTGPTGAEGPPGARLLPAGQVDTSALPPYYTERNVWAFDNDRSLQMLVMARDACAGVEATVTEQSPSAVTVVLRALDAPQGGPPDGQICAQVLLPKPATVRLAEPIGTRQVRLSHTGF